MSCPKDTNLQVRDDFGNLIAPIVKRESKCKNIKNIYPSFTPVINSLSVNSSISGFYTVVYIYGYNFLHPSIGTTYVNFGNYTKLPITFYNSFNISFVVPIDAISGIYNIKVVNIYNNNLCLRVKQNTPGIPNYSNNYFYLIEGIPFCASGLYNFSSDTSFNGIITFNGNGKITFFNAFKPRKLNYTIIFKNIENNSDIEVKGTITLPTILLENAVNICNINNNSNDDVTVLNTNSNSKTKFKLHFNY
jgi:hypothetical protein